MRRPTKQELTYWYRKIRKVDPEWVDIEGGRDLAQFNASTFPGGTGDRGAAFVSADVLDFVGQLQTGLSSDGGPVALGEHPTARYWRGIAQAAYDVPSYEPDRSFLVDAAQSDVLTAAKRHGLGRMSAHRRWQKFLAACQLPPIKHEPTTDAPQAPPVRYLNKRERRELERRLDRPPGVRRVYTKAEARAETLRRAKAKTDG